MTFEKSIDFIENKMKLSHIYQPLLIKNLIESGGTATIKMLREKKFRSLLSKGVFEYGIIGY